ncbi:oxidoreductase [Rhodovibrionaceae bacterium A322]
MTDKRYLPLFEPLTLGPVTAPNRFYQVPHCSGMGHRRPNTLAAMRGMKAEGGWGVVCTEYCSYHETSDDTPYPHARLWDCDDQKAQALMTQAVHEHGALAGVELWHGGSSSANTVSRATPLGVRTTPATSGPNFPVQSRAMDRQDIRDLRRWHRDAALRALEVDFDLVYVYATHGYLLHQFLSSATNDRLDEYGGSLENRARLVRELLEETREAVGHRMGLVCRYSLATEDACSNLEPEESRDLLAYLAEFPDLWDITIDDYSLEMGVSRFVKEAEHENLIAEAKEITGKPVVAVGRFTSPDTMARVIRQGVQDFIGAARPSIADPFLPNKIKEGREDEVRECIGCNICYAHDNNSAPLRCTQNPTMGEEWRRSWHPEKVAASPTPQSVLVVGSGPAGLEAARCLGQQGHQVTLAEAGSELGGRVTRESRLPGVSEWARVRDWRVGRLQQMANVDLYLESELGAEESLAFGAQQIILATGARWDPKGIGRWRSSAFTGWDLPGVVLADQILDHLAGEDLTLPEGPVVIFDDDHYYMGSLLALQLRQMGREVSIVTPEAAAGTWMNQTSEFYQNAARLIECGVTVLPYKSLEAFDGQQVTLSCCFTGKTSVLPAGAVLPLSRRLPQDTVFQGLMALRDNWQDAGLQRVQKIGDADAPGLIAAAVYAGHKVARELEQSEVPAALREQIRLVS